MTMPLIDNTGLTRHKKELMSLKSSMMPKQIDRNSWLSSLISRSKLSKVLKMSGLESTPKMKSAGPNRKSEIFRAILDGTRVILTVQRMSSKDCRMRMMKSKMMSNSTGTMKIWR
jgi:hypothetical protein